MKLLNSDNSNKYDLSFMYTKKCDLFCSFCMYESGPDINDALDINKLGQWLGTVDPSLIASFGVYGGEVGIDLIGFGKCLDLVQHFDRPRFVITNGTWSMDVDRTLEFMEFCCKYHLHIVVSGTPWHRKHQDRKVLERLKEVQPKVFTLKPIEEGFHAMGRLAGKMEFSCSEKCLSWDRTLRIAVQPDGSIIYQNCDGVYPVVGNIDENFIKINERVQAMRKKDFSSVCSYVSLLH